MKKIISHTYTDLGSGMGHGYAEEIEVVELTDECIERIGDAVAKKLSCDTCYIAQNYNLEDDDSPCLDCGVE